jgi:hypothetical protein
MCKFSFSFFLFVFVNLHLFNEKLGWLLPPLQKKKKFTIELVHVKCGSHLMHIRVISTRMHVAGIHSFCSGEVIDY